MTGSFQGAVVAHFEARRGSELDGLIRRQGGVPWPAPALSEVPIEAGDAELAIVDRLVNGEFDIVVLLTGVGTRRLLDEASLAGQLLQTKAWLARAITVARGPKPVFELRKHELKPTHIAPEPNTTQQLLDVLLQLPLAGKHVLVVNAGEPFAEPSTSLRERGAHPVELQLYRWDLAPTDAVRLERTIDELIGGNIDVAMFTTQVQVRHLFDVAARTGESDRLANALRNRVLVGAVGPTTATGLREHGVEPHVLPEHPKMGHLVVALANEIERRQPPLASAMLDYVSAVLGGGTAP